MTLFGTTLGVPRFGVLAYFGAGASLVVCFSKILIASFVPLVGIAAFEMNPHVQALFMWLFAAVAVVGLFFDRKGHGSHTPLAMGVAALAIIIGTLYTFYDVRVLMTGYGLLLVAAVLNQNRWLAKLNTTVVEQAAQLTELNASLERKVTGQVNEIERLARLKRFLPGEVADLITSEGKEGLLDSHRRYIACLFGDIRRFTSMTESMEPEDVMDVLRGFHEETGKLVVSYRGTIGYRAGDGVMVFFNDPIPCDDPDLLAVRLALDMRRTFDELRRRWDKLGVDVGLGIGIASGYCTLGVIGVEGRFDYTPIGNAVNVAARLGDHAGDGEILLGRRAYAEVESRVSAQPVGAIPLKGMAQPVEAFRVGDLAETSSVVTLPTSPAAKS